MHPKFIRSKFVFTFNCKFMAYLFFVSLLTICLRYLTEKFFTLSPVDKLNLFNSGKNRSHEANLYNVGKNESHHDGQSITILFWTAMYTEPANWQEFWFKDELLETGCTKVRCSFTTDRNRLNESRGILFHGYRENLIQDDLPRFRRPDQRWILFMNEPPEYPARNFSIFDHLFNWTMSYRTDSDVFGGYGHLVMEETNASSSTNFSSKTEIAAWFVSHCSTDGKREDYVKELQKYMPVHVYGRCGTGQYDCSDRASHKCYSLLRDKYKFYLSFENSLCKDYVTEKFYDIIPYDVVPVIFNQGRNNLMIPDSAYVDALSFQTPQHLAQYLLALHHNDQLYAKFFHWKNGKTVRNERYKRVVCDLCEKLSTNSEPKVYHNLQEWWFGKSKCRYWKSNATHPF